MNGKVVAAVAVVSALAAWYWNSPWPVAFAAALIALGAWALAESAARATALLASIARDRPMQMNWSFWVVLTDRAFDAMGIPEESRPEIKQRLGQWVPIVKGFPFKDDPAWISKPIVVRYERWGESLERWTIRNSWVAEEYRKPPAHHDKRVLEFLPAVHKPKGVQFWGVISGMDLRRIGGLYFCCEEGRLIMLNVDENTSFMPDSTLYVKEKGRILFDIPTPTLSMSRADWSRAKYPNDTLDRFVAPNDPGTDPFDPGRYYRHHGDERFECEDGDKGFRWELGVNDLRPRLDARVTKVHRSLWRGDLK